MKNRLNSPPIGLSETRRTPTLSRTRWYTKWMPSSTRAPVSPRHLLHQELDPMILIARKMIVLFWRYMTPFPSPTRFPRPRFQLIRKVRWWRMPFRLSPRNRPLPELLAPSVPKTPVPVPRWPPTTRRLRVQSLPVPGEDLEAYRPPPGKIPSWLNSLDPYIFVLSYFSLLIFLTCSQRWARAKPERAWQDSTASQDFQFHS
jgi:hypothetical protein